VQHYVCMGESAIAVLLLAAGDGDGRSEGGAQAQSVETAKPQDDWPSDLRWGQPQVVWNEERMAGVMGADGQWLGGCQCAGVLLFHEDQATGRPLGAV